MEVQYANDTGCAGIPSAVHIFAVYNPLSDFIPSNETWPIFFSWYPNHLFRNLNYPYRSCGNLGSAVSLPSAQYCCGISYDLSINGTFGLSSGADYMIPSLTPNDTDLQNTLPLGANGQTYCYLTGLTSASLAGYQASLYLSDGSCMDVNELPTQCFPNGTVNFFTGSNCLGGVVESVTLTGAATSFMTVAAGNVSGKMLTVHGGMMKTGWVMNVAATSFVLPISTIVEKIGFICYILALVGHLISILWSGKRQFERKSKQRLILLFSQILWFIAVAVDMVMVFITLDSIILLDHQQHNLSCRNSYPGLHAVYCYGAHYFLHNCSVYFRIRHEQSESTPD